MTFPTTLFHKDLAPEGQVFMTKEDLPDADGWVDTPAAFVAGYKPPKPVAPADSLPADAPPGFVPQPYPSYRYKVGDADNPVVVTTKEEDEALEAKEPGVWKHSHDAAAKVNQPADAGAPTSGKLVDLGAGDGDAPVVLTDAQKAEFYGAKVADIVVKLSAIGSVSQLEAIAAAEAENPKPRVTVQKAVKARLAELKASTE